MKPPTAAPAPAPSAPACFSNDIARTNSDLWTESPHTRPAHRGPSTAGHAPGRCGRPRSPAGSGAVRRTGILTSEADHRRLTPPFCPYRSAIHPEAGRNTAVRGSRRLWLVQASGFWGKTGTSQVGKAIAMSVAVQLLHEELRAMINRQELTRRATGLSKAAVSGRRLLGDPVPRVRPAPA